MTLNGYDISASQVAIDPSVVPGDFVKVKITGGDGYVNPNWQEEVRKVRAAGKLLGIYHFARDGYTLATAHSEAQWFLQHAADLIDGTVIPVLDWEGDNATDVAYAKAWLDEVTAATGVKPLIYISYKDIEAADWSSVANADYGCWEAAYVLGYQRIDGYNPPSGRATIPYWNTIVEWQYTSSGHLDGWPDNLDLDIFYGDASTWAAYARKSGTTTQSSTVTPITGDTVADLTPQNLTDIADAVLRRVCYDSANNGHTLFDVVASYQSVHDGVISKVNGHTDALVKGINLTVTDAQVQALADKLTAALPPAVLAALKAKL